MPAGRSPGTKAARSAFQAGRPPRCEVRWTLGLKPPDIASRSQGSVDGRPAASRISTACSPRAPPMARVTTASGQEPRAGLRQRRSRPCVDDRLHRHPGGGEVGGHGAGAVVVGEDHGAAARRRGVAVQVAPDGAGQHHAGPVVVAEHQRPLQAAGRQHAALRHDAPQALPRRMRLGHRQVVADPLDRAIGAVVEHAEHRGAAQDMRTSGRPASSDSAEAAQSGAAWSPTVPAFGQQAAAEAGALVAQDHPRPGAAGRQRRRQPGRAGADHQHVAVDRRLLVMVGVRRGGGAAEAGGAADQRLVDLLPEPGRPHEGLVVEAGGEDRGQQPVHRHQVEAEGRPAVLAVRLQPVEQLDHGGAAVRLPPRAAAQLDQRVRLLRPGREDAARAVIFERSSGQSDAVGQQGRGQGVAGMAREVAAVEAEAQRRRTVDQPAGGRRKELIAEPPWPLGPGRRRRRGCGGRACRASPPARSGSRRRDTSIRPAPRPGCRGDRRSRRRRRCRHPAPARVTVASPR